MQPLRIHLFGRVRIFNPESAEPARVTHNVQALLAYLMLHRQRSHSREVLAGLFWGDHPQERARGSMNTTLWRLRQVLEPAAASCGTTLLARTSGEITINPNSSYWLDVAAFEEQAVRVLHQPVETMPASDAAQLAAAVHLYTGELLEGFYDDWALHERARLHELYLSVLVRLMQYHAQHHAFQESLHWGQRVLHQDPLREEVQREMMRLYLADGQRTRALQSYEHYRHLLAAELGVAPMAETQALHTAILKAVVAQQKDVGAAVQSHHADVLATLRLALQSFDETRAHLQRVVELLEQTVEPPSLR